jgi:1-Cys peroxiredoxin 6
MPEFEKRNVKVIALSCNSVESHQSWIADVQHIAETEGEFVMTGGRHHRMKFERRT